MDVNNSNRQINPSVTPVPNQISERHIDSKTGGLPLLNKTILMLLVGLALTSFGFLAGYLVKGQTYKTAKIVDVVTKISPTKTPDKSQLVIPIENQAVPEELTISISPTSGPVGTKVTIKITGIYTGPLYDPALYFEDSIDRTLKTNLDTDINLNEVEQLLKKNEGKTINLTTTIPYTVGKRDSTNDNEGYPSIQTNTGLGEARIYFSYQQGPQSGDGKIHRASAIFIVTEK